jgi:uncharacterized Zn finger protein (UPF0148 family)
LAGVYREKECPRCGILHRKRGQYCSASCGNVRVHTEEDKKIRSLKMREHHLTPEAIAQTKRFTKNAALIQQGVKVESLTAEDYDIQLPDFDKIFINTEQDFIAGGDHWQSVDDDWKY